MEINDGATAPALAWKSFGAVGGDPRPAAGGDPRPSPPGAAAWFWLF